MRPFLLELSGPPSAAGEPDGYGLSGKLSRNFSRGVTKEGRKAEAVAAGRAIVT